MIEKELIKLLKCNDSKEEAFRKLISLYKERLYWHIRKIVKTHEDSDDVLQNTFIKIFKNISNFKEDAKLYSWMYRIATNEAINLLNKNAKQKKMTLEIEQQKRTISLQSDIYYDGTKIELKLQKAIATLPNKQQIVFNMKYFDAMKYTEISTILDTSVGALKASYHHAVKKIEKIIKLG